jgi:glycosyltransferase involved in cell wall biosynthesis
VVVLENSHGSGLSGARNTGAAAARGDVIAFVDDDATVIGEDWAAGLLAHFADPDVQVVGGSAVPTATALWLPPEFYWVIGCSYTGQPSAPAAVRNVLGCNMAIRRDALTTVGPFDSGIGRRRGRLPMGNEETDICIRVTSGIADARIVYDPRLVVRHEVTAERATVGYFARRCYAEGLSKARLSSLVGSDVALSSERTYTTRVLPRAAARELRRAMGSRSDGRGVAVARIAALVGGFTLTVAGYLCGRVTTPRRVAR